MLKKLIDRVKQAAQQKKEDTASKARPAAAAKKKQAPARKNPELKRTPPEVWVPGGGSAPVAPSEPSPTGRSPAPPAVSSDAPADESAAPKRRRRRSRGGRGRKKPAGDAPQTAETAPNDQPAEQREQSAEQKERPVAKRERPSEKRERPVEKKERSAQKVFTAPTHTPKNIAEFEGQLAFADMEIAEPVKRALDDMFFKVTTPIQARLLPIALAGRDAAGKAQTGTGKTAAFLISIFTRFLAKPIEGERPHGTPRALILAPTRELAIQITKDADDVGRYCGFHTVAVYGGMDFDKQQRELERPVDMIVATPGRLMDFAQRKVIHLKQVEVLVIDEADRMLDMGFIPDVRKIVRMTPHPEQRQTLLFSATLTPNIMTLAEQWTRNAETVEIEPERIAAESINQKVFITTQEEKFRLLFNLLRTEKPERVLIFSNRRDQAEMLDDHLRSYGFNTALLSGAVEQKKRLRVLDDFKSGKVSVLVATDVAGRGLHVEGISHVINYHMPMDPDDYVHRIGRTGRAGEIGTSISFACEVDSFAIPDIEKFIGHDLVCEHPSEDLLKPLPRPDYEVVRRPRTKTGGRPAGGRGHSAGGRRPGPGRGRPRRS